MPRAIISKREFANIDARVRCLTDDCWGELMLMPTGVQDVEGIPEFAPRTLCPLCGEVFDIEQNMTDRDLFLRISWLRANPEMADAEDDEAGG
ncbi:MAG: hypothetical protein H6531_00315 [Actinobacteria bacterium]|nr:hypothetical protein [Thermoleophilia bacterium]MCB9010259.1 hypothetical protein [Actinomycetota bacterium]